MSRRDALKLLATTGIATAALRSVDAADTRSHDESADFKRDRRVVTVGGNRIAYTDAGKGPAALFLHGWPLNGFHWRASVDQLKAKRRCLVPDLLGLGYIEAKADADLGPLAQTKMLLEFRDVLRVDRVDLVANDSGTAVNAPGRIRSMLLTNGDVDTNSPPPALAPALAAARAGTLDHMIERHLSDPAFAWSAQGLGGICYTDPRHLTRSAMRIYFEPLLATALRRAQFQAYGVAFEPTPLPAIADCLRTLQMPVRLLWGTGDVHFPVSTAEWLDGVMPNSRGIRRVAGAKLFFTEDFPDLVAREALKLWR